MGGATRDAAQARAGVDKFNRSLSGTERLVKRAGSAFAAYFAVRAVKSTLEMGSNLARAREQAEILLARFGETADSVLPRMRRHTIGLVRDFDILQKTAAALSSGVSLADLELIAQAAPIRAARRGETVSEALQRIIDAFRTAEIEPLINLGLTKQSLTGKDFYGKQQAAREFMLQLVKTPPTDTAVTRWERLTTTLANMRDTIAGAVVESPAFNELMERLVSYFDPERINRWAEAVDRALSNLSLEAALQRLELEVGRFLRTDSGKIFAAMLGGTAGAKIGSLGGPAAGVGGFLIGASAGVLAGDYYDPIKRKAEAIREDFRIGQDRSPERLAEQFSSKWLLTLRDEIGAEIDKHGDLQKLPRSVLYQTPDYRALTALIDAYFIRTAQERKLQETKPAPGPAPTGEPKYTTIYPFVGPLKPTEPNVTSYGDLFREWNKKNKEANERADRLYQERQNILAGAATALTDSFLSLDVSARALGERFGSLFSALAQEKIQRAILERKQIEASGGSFLGSLAAGLGFLGVGTILGALFGGKQEQEKQTEYLDAIARNTDRSAELLQKALGTPEGFRKPTLTGSPSYSGLGALAYADTRR